jgi:trehalose 6-phosphate phosphatase
MRLWFFDFDGTLSPIVSDRNAATLHPACAGMLKELSQSPSERVAIISSRSLGDILPRVPLDGIIIGGSSGIEWQFPGGGRISPGTGKKSILQARRRKLLPLIENFSHTPGIDIEDKLWSVAVHMKGLGKNDQIQMAKTFETLAEDENITQHHGPDVLEIQFVPGFNKSVGASTLVSLLKIDPRKDTIIYAGDDENDAVAMKWAIANGGSAIMVGSRLDVPGAVFVQNQEKLVAAVKMLRKGC